jgi:hypothetical protein
LVARAGPMTWAGRYLNSAEPPLAQRAVAGPWLGLAEGSSLRLQHKSAAPDGLRRDALGEVRWSWRVGFLDQWTADVQRRSDERAAQWHERQREKARTGRMTFLDRWAARAQRKGDEHAAEWEQRQREKVLSGRVTFMDRWAAHAQRKGDEAAAKWLEIAPTRKLLASGPVKGPSDATAVIYVQPTGSFLEGRHVTKQGAIVRRSGGGGFPGNIIGQAYLLTAVAIWLAYRRSYTVHVHTNGDPPKIHVRLPTELAAYRAAADLVPRFQAEGTAALERWRVDAASAVRTRKNSVTEADVSKPGSVS